MRVAIDSNILIYVEGVGDEARRLKAKDILDRLPIGGAVVPVQVLGEVFRVLRRKGRRSVEDCRTSVEKWRALFDPHETSVAAFENALELTTGHGFQIWDAVILAASAEAGCSLLLSEDMHDGFVWRGVTIVNPFSAQPHRRLAAILRPEGSVR